MLWNVVEKDIAFVWKVTRDNKVKPNIFRSIYSLFMKVVALFYLSSIQYPNASIYTYVYLILFQINISNLTNMSTMNMPHISKIKP